MAFMEHEITHGEWYVVDGPMGTEYIPADLVGNVTITKPDGTETTKTPTLEDLQQYDRVMGIETEQEGDSVRMSIPSLLKDYCENREAWSIEVRTGYGARLSAPGYLDCTEWCVFDTQTEAEAYLADTYGDDEEENDDDDN